MADNNVATTENSDLTFETTIRDLGGGMDLGDRTDWGNKLVVNTGTNPVINFAFMLRVEGVFDLPCKSIKGIRRENEFDYIQEGGLNDYVHLKRKPLSKPCTFQVERYVGVNWVDPMPLGTELVLPVILFVNKYCFPQLKPVRTYAFTGCTVISKDYGELNAEASGLLVETVTIAYREMVCVDIPSETLEGDVWKFKGKEREGEGPRRYNSNLLNKEWETEYASRQSMEKRAEKQKYAHTLQAKKYNSAKHHNNESSLSEMAAKADKHKWAQEKDNNGEFVAKPKYGNDYEKYVTDYNTEIEKKLETETDAKERARLEAMKKAMGGAASRKWPTTESGKDYEKYVTDYNGEIDKQIKAATEKAEKDRLEGTKKAMGGAANRKWPTTESAKKEKMKVPEAKKWDPENEDTQYYGRDYEQYVTNYNAEIEKKLKTEKDAKEKARLEAMKKVMGGAASRQWPPTESGKDYEKYVTDYNGEIDKQIKAATEKAEKDRLEATKKAMGGAASRKWPEIESAKKEEMKVPEAKKWDHLKETYGKDYEKYVTDYNEKIQKQIDATPYGADRDRLEGMKKAMGGKPGRKWPEIESATKAKMEVPEARQYAHSKENPKNYSSAKHHDIEVSKTAMEANAKKWPKETSAKRKSMKKSKARKWPKESSAAKEVMKVPETRVWPKESSAKSEPMKVPEARLWPQKKSARQITDFLKKH